MKFVPESDIIFLGIPTSMNKISVNSSLTGLIDGMTVVSNQPEQVTVN